MYSESDRTIKESTRKESAVVGHVERRLQRKESKINRSMGKQRRERPKKKWMNNIRG